MWDFLNRGYVAGQLKEKTDFFQCKGFFLNDIMK